MYAAQMINECGLNEWTTNSIIIHAKSKHVEGPYVYVEDILGVWGHNPQPHRAPDGTYILYHIGWSSFFFLCSLSVGLFFSFRSCFLLLVLCCLNQPLHFSSILALFLTLHLFICFLFSLLSPFSY